MRGKLYGTGSFLNLLLCCLSEGLIVTISFPYGWRKCPPPCFCIAIGVHCCSVLVQAPSCAHTSPGIRGAWRRTQRDCQLTKSFYHVLSPAVLLRAWKAHAPTIVRFPRAYASAESCCFVHRFVYRHLLSASTAAVIGICCLPLFAVFHRFT